MSCIDRHNEEIQRNRQLALQKPLLKRIYRDFHQRIAAKLTESRGLATVELGSGVSDITEVIPGCVRTDLFPNPWIDRIENAYAMNFASGSLSNLILFDVFHHLQYPGTALAEFRRVLRPGGRVILFEPCLSLLGWLVYGLLHPEPVGRFQAIEWMAPDGPAAQTAGYFAAQGNASRIFLGSTFAPQLEPWRVVERRRLSAVSYVASGGYSGPQLYPQSWYPLLQRIDALCDLLPAIFATRLLVVLEKR